MFFITAFYIIMLKCQPAFHFIDVKTENSNNKTASLSSGVSLWYYISMAKNHSILLFVFVDFHEFPL